MAKRKCIEMIHAEMALTMIMKIDDNNDDDDSKYSQGRVKFHTCMYVCMVFIVNSVFERPLAWSGLLGSVSCRRDSHAHVDFFILC